jgi:hypothetical protein
VGIGLMLAQADICKQKNLESFPTEQDNIYLTPEKAHQI